MIRPRFSRFFGVLLGVLGQAAEAGAQVDTRSWVSVGPDGIESILSIAIDPTSSATVYTGTDGAGVYKSTDGGTTWFSASTGLANSTVLALAVDPSVPAIVYAGTLAGLFVSRDGATTWSLVMRSRSGTTRWIEAEHRFEKLERYSAIESR